MAKASLNFLALYKSAASFKAAPIAGLTASAAWANAGVGAKVDTADKPKAAMRTPKRTYRKLAITFTLYSKFTYEKIGRRTLPIFVF